MTGGLLLNFLGVVAIGWAKNGVLGNFARNNGGGCGGIFALRAQCALLLDYVPPEELPSTPLGNALRIRWPINICRLARARCEIAEDQGRLGPKRGGKCYVTLAFSGIPKQRGTKSEVKTSARGHHDAPRGP